MFLVVVDVVNFTTLVTDVTVMMDALDPSGQQYVNGDLQSITQYSYKVGWQASM